MVKLSPEERALRHSTKTGGRRCAVKHRDYVRKAIASTLKKPKLSIPETAHDCQALCFSLMTLVLKQAAGAYTGEQTSSALSSLTTTEDRDPTLQVEGRAQTCWDPRDDMAWVPWSSFCVINPDLELKKPAT